MTAVVCCGLAVGTAPAIAYAAGDAVTVRGSWGPVQQVRGLPNAVVTSVACVSAGNCVAAGWYAGANGNEAFTVTQTGGSWGKAQEVPGIGSLNANGQAVIKSVSCAAPGNCAAGGYYTDSSGYRQAFVVSESRGSWGKAQKVAAALNKFEAMIVSVSCTGPGDCAAAGFYTDPSSDVLAFVVTETAGSWGKAQEVAAALNTRGDGAVNSVSCAAPGDCAAGGYYLDGDGQHAFVVTETAGSWGKAQEVAAALNPYGYGAVNAVSCASPGNCAAAGFATTAVNASQAFVVNETKGSWGTAREVTSNLSSGRNVAVTSMSCPSLGYCAAGGFYTGSSTLQAFVVTETAGSWGMAREVAAALNTGGRGFGGQATVNSVSCASPGTCAAVGYATGRSGGEAFVADETRGSWDTATEVAAAVNTGGDAEAYSVSCPSPGICVAGGYYKGSVYQNGYYRAFVVDEAQATSASLSLSARTVTYGKEQAERLSVTVRPRYAGTPSGTVTVTSGTATICTITLAAAKGTCRLTARELKAGHHTLIAAYHGNSHFLGSTSAKAVLTVAK